MIRISKHINVKYMEKRTKTTGVTLEDLAKCLPIEPREKLALKLKSTRIEANETPQIEDIVQLKEDLPRD